MVHDVVMSEPKASSGLDTLLLRDEVAAALRKPPSWLRYCERHHLIPFVRVGQQIRYRQGDLARWLDERAVASAQED